MSTQPDIFDLLSEVSETPRRSRSCCDSCGQRHHPQYARARHLFGPADGVRYAASTAPGAPERMTRDEAIADECAHRAATRSAS